MYISTHSASYYSPSYYLSHDPRDDDIYIDPYKYAKENYTALNALDFIDDTDRWQELEEEYLFRIDRDADSVPNLKDIAWSGKIDNLIHDWLFEWRLDEYAEYLWEKYA